MSGRRCRALRKLFREQTGRPAIRREQRWLKSFYRRHKHMNFGFRRVAPPTMSLWERAERIPPEALASEAKPLTANTEIHTVESV